jgi:small GTP-binding protein
MPEMKYFRRKICLLGDAAVGKTSLIRRFVEDVFDDKYLVTLGTKVTMKELNIESPQKKQTLKMTLMIWDIMGQKELKRLLTSFYNGAKGALIVADITRKETLESIDDWILSLHKSVGKVPVLLLLNKSDLMDQTAIKQDEVMNLVKKHDTSFLFTSAKTGKNVDKAFMRLSEMLLQKEEKKRSSAKVSMIRKTNLSSASEGKFSTKIKVPNILKDNESV